MADDQTDTTDTDQTGQTDGQQDDAQGADQQQTDDQNTDQLGDAGKQALDRMKAERNAARKELREFKGLGLSVDEFKALMAKAKPADDAPDPEEIRREATAEAQAKANARILRSEVKAAAAGKLADPADAYKFLDLSQFEVDDDGNVDDGEISDAIDELLRGKPYLAAQQNGQRRFQGSADAGARRDKPLTLNDRIAEAEKSGDSKSVARLKARQALAVASSKT